MSTSVGEGSDFGLAGVKSAGSGSVKPKESIECTESRLGNSSTEVAGFWDADVAPQESDVSQSKIQDTNDSEAEADPASDLTGS